MTGHPDVIKTEGNQVESIHYEHRKARIPQNKLAQNSSLAFKAVALL